jgi:hypothetical protein
MTAKFGHFQDFFPIPPNTANIQNGTVHKALTKRTLLLYTTAEGATAQNRN